MHQTTNIDNTHKLRQRRKAENKMYRRVRHNGDFISAYHRSRYIRTVYIEMCSSSLDSDKIYGHDVLMHSLFLLASKVDV